MFSDELSFMINLFNIFLHNKRVSNIVNYLNVTLFTDLLLKDQSVSPTTSEYPFTIFALCNRLETCLRGILEARGGANASFCILSNFLFKPVKLTPVRYYGGQLYINARKVSFKPLIFIK